MAARSRRRFTPPEPLLTPAEVAGKFDVTAKTVTIWSNKGHLDPIRTLGGHRRYRESDVKALLAKRGKPGNPGA